MRRNLTFALIGLAFAVLGGVRDLAPASRALAQTPPAQTWAELPDQLIPSLGQATKLTRTGAGTPQPAAATQQQPLTLTFTLNRTDEAGFQAYLRSVSTPGPHSYLSQSQLAAQFGPSQQAYDALLAHLESHGFT